MRYCFYLDFAGWKPEVWAAWVQAIGSVAAILAAYILARRAESLAHGQAATAAMLRAKSRALALVTPVQIYANTIRPAFEEVASYGIDSYPNLLETTALPNEIVEAAQSIHELGPAAESFLKFVRAQQLTQRSFHEVIEADSAGVDGPQMDALELASRTRFDTLYTAVAVALDSLNILVDSAPARHTSQHPS